MLKISFKYTLFFMLVMFGVAIEAYAAGPITSQNLVFAQYICKLRTCFLTNRLIYTVCGIAFTFLALMIMFGRATWTMALVTIVGVLICMSAYKIVNGNLLFPNAVPTALAGVAISAPGNMDGGGVIGSAAPGSTGVVNVNVDPCIATSCYFVVK